MHGPDGLSDRTAGPTTEKVIKAFRVEPRPADEESTAQPLNDVGRRLPAGLFYPVRRWGNFFAEYLHTLAHIGYMI
jgi:hypothetical protein